MSEFPLHNELVSKAQVSCVSKQINPVYFNISALLNILSIVTRM